MKRQTAEEYLKERLGEGIYTYLVVRIKQKESPGQEHPRERHEYHRRDYSCKKDINKC